MKSGKKISRNELPTPVMRNACNAVRFGQLEDVLVVSLNLVESDNVDEWMNAISASNTHVVRNITWRGERHVVGVLQHPQGTERPLSAWES